MWLGAVTGLALLTLSNLARPIHALVTLADNQQLRYDGSGWESSGGPQACSAVSQTVHTTKTTGNFLTFNFIGNAISVLGPQTSLSSPMTAILDGTVQRLPPSTQDGDGCGILYSVENVTNSPHTLVLIYHAQTGSVDFSVSGISVTAPNAVTSTGASPTVFQVSSNPSPSAISITTATPLSTARATTVSAPAANSSTPAIISSTPANPAAAPTSSAASTSAVATSAFATTPGMTIGLVAAIIGTIIGMFTLLMFFIVVRRRITSTSARQMDQENTFGRGNREHQMEAGKSNLVAEDASWPVLAGGKKAQLPVFDMQNSGRWSQTGVTAVPGISPSASIPAAVASGSDVHPGLGITNPSPRGDRFTRASVYSVDFGTTISSRVPSQQYPEAVVPWTSTADPHHQKPLPLTVSVPPLKHSDSHHGLTDTPGPGQSPGTPPPSWFSRDATQGPSTNDMYAAPHGGGANVVTRAGSVGDADLPPRPPGFF